MGQIAPLIAVEERKEKLTEKLSTQYSLNLISMEEYERLIKYSQNIETDKELTILEKIIEEHNPPAENREADNNDARPVSGGRQNHFTLLSSRKTTGPLTSGNYTTILGDHRLVIDESDLINDKTVLNVKVLLGDMVISVPENVNVISKVIPILADVSVSGSLKNKNCKKKLIIKGSVILGDVKVRVRR